MREDKFKVNIQLFADETSENEETKEEKIDLEEIKKNMREEILSEIEKEKREKENNDTLETLKDKIALIEKSKSKANESLEVDVLRSHINELTEALNVSVKKLEETSREANMIKVKSEILKKADKETYLKDTLQEYLDNGKIKTLEDFDAVFTPNLKKRLKEYSEIMDKAKGLGADPANDYANDVKGDTHRKATQTSFSKDDVINALKYNRALKKI